MNSILCRDTVHLDSRSIESVPVVRSSSSTGGWYALYPITVSLIFYIPLSPPLKRGQDPVCIFRLGRGVYVCADCARAQPTIMHLFMHTNTYTYIYTITHIHSHTHTHIISSDAYCMAQS